MPTPSDAAESKQFLGFDLTIAGEEEVGTPIPEPVAASEPEETLPTQVEPTPDEKDKQRFEYWQSVAQKREAELERLKFAAPVARLLDEKPEIAAKIDEIIAGRAEVRSVPTPEELLQRPDVPVRPNNFDELEAFQNPESESFKYRKQVEDYNRNLVEYIDKRDQLRDQRIQKQDAERQQAEQARVETAKLKLDLAKSGLSDAEQEDFIQKMSSRESLKLENLVKLYRMSNGPTPDDIKRQEAAEALARRTARHEVPLPAAVGGSPSQVQLEEGDQFSASLIQRGRPAKR